MEPTERELTDSELRARIERNALRQIDDRLQREHVPVGEIVEVLRLLWGPQVPR